MVGELRMIEGWALKNKRVLLSILSSGGIILIVYTGILAPIHEFGHIAACYLTGRHGHFVNWNTSSTTYIGIFHEFVYGMGHGMYGIVMLGIYFTTKKNHYTKVMLKTLIFFLPFDYCTLTDFTLAPGGVAVLILINILLWRIAFGPFKGAVKNYQKKHNTVRMFSDNLTKQKRYNTVDKSENVS